MDVREVLLPRMLKQAGYYSGIFGKWDLGIHRRFLPLQRGFDEFYGFVNTGIDYYTHERYGVPSMYRNNEPTIEDKGTYCTYLFQREAVRFVRENKDRPFFLYLPFNAPHGASSLDPKIRGGAAGAGGVAENVSRPACQGRLCRGDPRRAVDDGLQQGPTQDQLPRCGDRHGRGHRRRCSSCWTKTAWRRTRS